MVPTDRIGFIGLGQVGSGLSGCLARNGANLTVFDLNAAAMEHFTSLGAKRAASVQDLAAQVDILITCLPSPAATRSVMEGAEGAMQYMSAGCVWLEMSTTDPDEIRRLTATAATKNISVLDCPVSGGCHRAATGNISIFAGGARTDFERVLPVLSLMGRSILHTGPVGSASILKVVTNYLATAHLAALSEAFAVAAAHDMDLAIAYEAIRISSGNSFVHETEGQVILNGSRDVGFTMELARKDIGFFQKLADERSIPLELSPLLISIFEDGAERYGAGEWSTNIVRRLEDRMGQHFHADGFPASLVDKQPAAPGREIAVGSGINATEETDP